MRDAAFACIRRIGVDTGGSNIQFAVDPATGEMVVIEMNPRVSRSSALASKATGFPIAKIAACLAVGYRLDEIRNDITGETPASFEPTIDYVVTKIPRWAFEKLPGASPILRTADAVGRGGDGDRADVPRVAPEGDPQPRDRPAGPQRRPGRGARSTSSTPRSWSTTRRRRPRTGCSSSKPRSAGACRSSGSPRSPASTRGSSTSWPGSPRPAPRSREPDRRVAVPARVADREAARLRRRAARAHPRRGPRRRSAGPASPPARR